MLDAVAGYKIVFDENPVQNRIPGEIPFNNEEKDLVQAEVQNMLKLGAIVPSEHETDEFISTIFIVPKPGGKFRPVINLKYLNEFVHYDHFKQETFKIVLDLIQENDFFTSVDLKDAYFSVPIHEDYQKYLKFSFNGNLYKFVCIPFGLKSAPYVFTKILKPIYAWFRQKSIRCSYYIDDSLNMNGCQVVCGDNTKTIVNTLENLGYVINQKKSVLVPTQRIVFFGFVLDSVLFKVFLTEEKLQKILLYANTLCKQGRVVVRQLASFIGLIINAFFAILEAPLHYRALERDKLRGLGEDMCYDNQVELSQSSKEEIQWWINNVVSKNGKRIRPQKATILCRTDASLQGWGAIDMNSGQHANGRWSNAEGCMSINFLELLAIFKGFQVFYDKVRDSHIQIETDNSCSVAYVNSMGGMCSQNMDNLASRLWNWCIDRNIYISAVHIPGVLNTADYYSRNFSDSVEWMLKQDIFIRLCSHFVKPDIDLFASINNRQLHRYVSWCPESEAVAADAFSIDWGGYRPYIFAPFNLIGKVLNKIMSDKVDQALLVFPIWMSQSWFPVLLECIASFPVRLPRHKDLLCQPSSGTPHPMNRKLRMGAAIVSGNISRREDFRVALQNLSFSHGREVPENSTGMRGNIGWLGTVSGIRVPLKRLK